MQTGQSTGVSFIVFNQPSASRCPAERAFDHPTSGQRHAAALGFGQFDNFQGDAALLGRFGGLLAGISLIDVGKRDALAGGILDGISETRHLGTIIDVGGRNVQSQ